MTEAEKVMMAMKTDRFYKANGSFPSLARAAEFIAWIVNLPTEQVHDILKEAGVIIETSNRGIKITPKPEEEAQLSKSEGIPHPTGYQPERIEEMVEQILHMSPWSEQLKAGHVGSIVLYVSQATGIPAAKVRAALESVMKKWKEAEAKQDTSNGSHYKKGVIQQKHVGQPLDPFLIDAIMREQTGKGLTAFQLTALKKVLAVGERGKKSPEEDLNDIIGACNREKELIRL